MSSQAKEISLKNYTKIIGSGGFGLILGDNDNNVVKLFYTVKNCASAQSESQTHLSVYQKLQEFVLSSKTNYQIYTSKPYGYRDDKISHLNQEFNCAYLMSYIKPVKIDQTYPYLIHLILKEEYINHYNKVVGRVYTSPPGDDNPPRGYFATIDKIASDIIPSIPSSIRQNINSIEDIVYRFGLLVGICVIGVEIIPIDAEYVFSLDDNNTLVVTILDFGMCERMKLENFPNDSIRERTIDTYVDKLKYDISTIDLYFPYTDSALYKYIKDGFRKTSSFFLEREKNTEIRDNKKEIIEKFLS